MNNDFITTTQGFTVSGAFTANYASSCSSYYVVGGPSNFGSGSYLQKIYTSLPDHFRARITFLFLKIGNWNNETVILNVDSINIPTSIYFNSSTDSSIMKICGNSSYTEAIRPVDMLIDHNISTLDLKITTNLNNVSPNVASWGIYDLGVSIDMCNLTSCKSCSGPTNFDCLSCNAGKFLQFNPGPSSCESSCPDGFYPDYITNE